MKACVLEKNQTLTFKEVEKPKLNKGEVLIKIKACGICSSDFSRVHNNGAYFYPLILGHEFAGIIENCAEDINNDCIGKSVVVFPLLPCNECEFCKQKLYAQCQKYSYFGSRQNGAMAEYIAVPIWNVKYIPDDIDYSVAAMCEPTSVAIHTISKIENIKGKSICISGSGTIGIMCGLFANELGADVTFIVRNNEKKEFLKNLGFNDFIDENNDLTFDILIECVGSNTSINNCIKLVKSHGKVVLVGNPADEVIEFSKKTYWKILRSEISIIGIWNSTFKNKDPDDWDRAIEFLYRNQNKLKNLITDKFKLKDGIKAFEQKKENKIRVKGVFVNEE